MDFFLLIHIMIFFFVFYCWSHNGYNAIYDVDVHYLELQVSRMDKVWYYDYVFLSFSWLLMERTVHLHWPQWTKH